MGAFNLMFGPPSGGPTSHTAPSPHAGTQATPFVFGYEYDRDTGRIGEPVQLDGHFATPVVILGGSGAGKQRRILNRLYMQARGQSQVILDTKGTAYFQTGAERALFSKTYRVNPWRLHRMGSDGFNAIARINPDDRRFRGQCLACGDAIIEQEKGTGQHFTRGAVALIAVLIGDEVAEARRVGRVPYLPNIRKRLCEPERWDKPAGIPGRTVIAGLARTLRRIAESGHPAVRDLAANYVREAGQNEIAGLVSTAEKQSRILYDPHMIVDMHGMGADLTQLCDVETSAYICIPPEQLSEFRPWTRLVLRTALNEHFRPGRHKTVFVLDEFRTTIADMEVVRDVWALTREYRAQFVAVLQSLKQISNEAMWGDEFENMLGQAGAVVQLGPPADPFSANFLSARSGKTTVPQMTFNENVGDNAGDNRSLGFGTQMAGGVTRNDGTGSQFGSSRGWSLGISPIERPAVPPQELLNMQPGEGRAWFPNCGDFSVPFFAPDYSRVCAEWARRIRDNPFSK